MRNPERANHREEKLNTLYLKTRRQALSLALCGAQNDQQAYAIAKKAYLWAGKRVDKHTIDEADLLHHVYSILPKRMILSSGSQNNPPAFLALDLNARCAWALTRAANTDAALTQEILGLSRDQLDMALRRANAVLTDQDAETFTKRLDALLARREIWSDISFDLARKMKRSRLVLGAAGVMVVLILSAVLFREAWMGLRILRYPGTVSKSAIADSYESEQFYKRFREEPSFSMPRVSQILMDRLEQIPESQPIRVAFRFYDKDVLGAAKRQGKTLDALYTRMFDTGLDRGNTHRLIAGAISQYYENYQRPFQPDRREQDFVSRFDGIYESAIHLAGGSGYEATINAHPEIFGSPEAFYAYLTGSLFTRDAQAVLPLLMDEMDIMNSRLEGSRVPSDLREAYEESIFAFLNPEGMAGRLTIASFIYTDEETLDFFTAREEMGKMLYEENKKRCLSMLSSQDVTSDILEGGESGLFSATLTKQEILSFASQDERFFFLGIAAPLVSCCPGRLEHGLGEIISGDLMKRHDVYQIDGEYHLYGINYAAPLLLPQGFINDLRAKIPCRDTAFEKSIQYIYQMRYAHPQERSGYGLLRALMGTGELRFTSDFYKHFSKMAAY